jgi:hypothetical protein
MIGCAALVVLGVAVAFRWRNYELLPLRIKPGGDTDMNPWLGLCWLLTVGALTGALVGVLIIGPAARLVMRLLAASSPAAAQGRTTEAEAVVGEITLDGTLSIILFIGLLGGISVGLVYVFAAFALPSRVLGGAVFGALLLVLFSSRIDPLRADNPDFDILSPGWAAVATFSAMAILTGAVTAPVAGRLGAALPAPRPRWALWLVPLGLLAVLSLLSAWPALLVTVIGSTVYLLYYSVPGVRRFARERGRRVLQVAVAGVTVLALPGFLAAANSIAT